MSTPPAITEILDWFESELGKLAYSQNSGRLDPMKSGYGDCSSTVSYAYSRFAHLNIGTFTGNECEHGSLVTTSKSVARAGKGMLPGDLTFYQWPWHHPSADPWDHVNIYKGDGMVYNHGGPGKGPVVQSLQHNVDGANKIMVRRLIQPVSVKHPWPLKVGQVYGPMNDPSNDVIGGFNPSERPGVKVFQSGLCRAMRVKDGSDGTWGQGTTDLLVKWREKTGHHSATPHYAGEATWRLVLGYTGSNT